jgi:hypothetical protein
LDQYRGQYIYNLAEIKSFCKNQPINCPLALHKNYTMNASLFLSVDDGQHYAFGSGNVNEFSYYLKNIKIIFEFIIYHSIGKI